MWMLFALFGASERERQLRRSAGAGVLGRWSGVGRGGDLPELTCEVVFVATSVTDEWMRVSRASIQCS